MVVAGRRESEGQAVLDAIKKSGGEGTFVKKDVGREVDVKAMVDRTVAAFGRFDFGFKQGIRVNAVAFGTVEMGVLIWNFEGEIVEANDSFLKMVQYDREDLVKGRVRWTDLTPAEWRDRDARALNDLKKAGTAQPYEKEFLRKQGNRVPVLVGGALFEKGGNEGVAFVFDLTEQKCAEKALPSASGAQQGT